MVVPFASGLAAAQAPASSAPVGPFTAAQATRGKLVYEQSCAACHGASLEGGSAPSLAGRSFEVRWRLPTLTLDDLFYVVRTQMPPKAAGTVSLEDHAAALAYILAANGYAAGPTPLELGSPGLNAKFAWAGKYLTDEGDTADSGTGADVLAADADAAPGVDGPDQATLDAGGRSTDWLVNAHDYAGTRYSPLDQVNVGNAMNLAPACMFQVGEKDNFQTGPIVHRGTLYLTTARSTIALDAATCRVKWRRAWKLRGDIAFNRNRGVAIKDGKLVRGTPDGYLVALSTETGAQLWARRVANPNAGETFSMAPVIYDDLVLIGPAGSELNLKGWVGAFRLVDGSPVWRFNTVPHPGEPGYETWHNPKNIPMGGGGVWTSFSVDTATGDVHLAVTNPAPDIPVQLRLGDNLYTNSIVVLDIRTGKLRWYRSIVPKDSHDWDLTHAMPLFTATINGRPRRLVTTAGKDGMLRVLDRDTHAVMYSTAVTTIENAASPVTTTPKRVCPGVFGGVQWSGPSYSAHTAMLYVPAVDWCATFSADVEARYIPGHVYLGGDVDMDPPGKAQGWLTAIDAATGAVKWKYRSPRPMVASVTTTAGDLVFTGELTGDFLALDARSGAVLYRFNTGGPMGGGIVTYEAGGRQYIAAASGTPSVFWVDKNGGAPTLVVFALPQQRP
jgi:alcohol dehydrogenase (cytochrome c)